MSERYVINSSKTSNMRQTRRRSMTKKREKKRQNANLFIFKNDKKINKSNFLRKWKLTWKRKDFQLNSKRISLRKKHNSMWKSQCDEHMKTLNLISIFFVYLEIDWNDACIDRYRDYKQQKNDCSWTIACMFDKKRKINIQNHCLRFTVIFQFQTCYTLNIFMTFILLWDVCDFSRAICLSLNRLSFSWNMFSKFHDKSQFYALQLFRCRKK